MRNALNLFVIAIIGAVALPPITTLARPRNASVTLAQDDWVRVPAPSDGSEPTHSSSQESAISQDSEAANGHPQRGGDNASVTIVEYSDFQCPYCRQVESSLRQVLRKYGNRVRLVYMDFPLAFHQHAMEAAIAARCADEQGRFWPYHDALFANSPGLSTTALKTTAAQVGLNSLTFDRCLDERKYENAVVADRSQGESAGVRGTPYFIVGSHAMDGAQTPSAFESAIDDQLRGR